MQQVTYHFRAMLEVFSQNCFYFKLLVWFEIEWAGFCKKRLVVSATQKAQLKVQKNAYQLFSFWIFRDSVSFFFRLSEFFCPLLARQDTAAGVEQPFGCLIAQNRQAV